MAGGVCDTPHDPPVQATFVGAFLESGDSVSLCDDCMVPWSAALLGTMTGMDMTPFFEALQRLDEEAALAAEGAPTDEPPPPAPADTDGDPPPPGAAIDDEGEPAPVSHGAPGEDAPTVEAA